MPDQQRPAPPPLVVASSLAALEGVALVVGGVLEIVNVNSSRVAVGVSLAVFFVAYGALLMAGAVALLRVVPWPRGPVLISQLIMLGLAWGLRDQPLAAIGLAVVAVITIAGLVHPASIAALEAARNRDQESGSND